MPTPDESFFLEAARMAMSATCTRAKCGAIVVLDGVIIGRGFNSPAAGTPSKCHLELRSSPKPKSDRTCCVHAEWRAIMEALRTGKDLKGAILYFSRCDDQGNPLRSGAPYCTVCSRLALDAGISFFGLWHESGPKLYDTVTYNDLSYAYHMQPVSPKPTP